MLRKVVIVLLCLQLGFSSAAPIHFATAQLKQADEPQKDEKPAPVKPMTPMDALHLALADSASLPREIALQRRYLWCPHKTQEEYAAIAFTLNTTWSHSTVDVYPKILGDGSLVAIDLRLCAPDDEKKYDELRLLWEKLAVKEPYFHVFGRYKQKIAPIKNKDGSTTDFKWVEGFVPAPYLGTEGSDLEQSSGSYAGILRADYWLVRSLDAANSGLYYEARGLTVGKTKLDDYLVSRGASREQAKRVRADEKAIFMSEVTDKPRAVTMFPTSSTRLSVGLGVAAITDDPFDETDDAQFDPYRNFLENKTNGHEVFVTTPSGWLEYTLWNADGDLVREAPPNLVADHRIPEPHTRRLQGAIACIRCHGPKDLWQPFTNEVAIMVANQLNVFGDLKTKKNSQYEVLQRLAGLYSGDLTDVLIQARNGAAKRVFAVTKMQPADAAAAVAKVYGDYEYQRVTAKLACFELGETVSDTDTLGVETFRKLVPPLDPNGQVLDDPVISRLHISFQDIDRKALRGLTLTRRQWEQIYADCMNRLIAGRTKGDSQ